MKIWNRIKVGMAVLQGYAYKYGVDANYLQIPSLRNKYTGVVVSLTSYGRRVDTNVVFYTIVSILRQRVQPDRIILWLAEDEWKEKRLPSKLSKLLEKGVEIKMCEDLRSYKKLIPALAECPNSVIITVDDDIIYSDDMIETMLGEHREYPDSIVCFKAKWPVIKGGFPNDYELWRLEKQHSSGMLLFPIGYGGILYPPHCLHKDVIRKDLFTKYSPKADDVWFWFCGLLQMTEKRVVVKKGMDKSFDALYQYFHRGTALTHANRYNHENDVQIEKIFQGYNVRIGNDNQLKKTNNA